MRSPSPPNRGPAQSVPRPSATTGLRATKGVETDVVRMSPPAHESSDQAAPNLNRDRQRRVSHLLGLLLTVAAVSAVGRVDGPVSEETSSETGDNARYVALKIDPNRAPWWELTIIPGIGEVTAQSIVSFRSSADVLNKADGRAMDEPFRQPIDLQAVRGIGPKTAARMEPYLLFPDS